MKQALLLFSSLILSIFSFAQINSPGQDHIKIIVAKDSLHVSFKSKSFKLKNIQDLDGWLKQNITETSSQKLPGLSGARTCNPFVNNRENSLFHHLSFANDGFDITSRCFTI